MGLGAVFSFVSLSLKDKSGTVVRSQGDDDINLPRKDLEILIETLDRRIHRAIELDQLIILSSEMLKDKLNRERTITKLEEVDESLERISSSGAESGQILHEIRIKLKGLLDAHSKES
jgi:hypothetical protein